MTAPSLKHVGALAMASPSLKWLLVTTYRVLPNATARVRVCVRVCLCVRLWERHTLPSPHCQIIGHSRAVATSEFLLLRAHLCVGRRWCASAEENARVCKSVRVRVCSSWPLLMSPPVGDLLACLAKSTAVHPPADGSQAALANANCR